MLDIANVISTAVGIVVGGLISLITSLWVAQRYYVKSSRDLDAAAAELRTESRKARHVTTALARYLDEAGVIRAQWNADGELIGVHPITVAATQKQRASVDYEVIRAPVFTDSDAQA